MEGISIIIPTYNNFKYLSLCIESIIKGATSNNYGIYICDDGSNDFTEYLTNNDNYNLFIEHIEHSGQFTAFNKAFISGGRYAYYMIVNDDMVLPKKWDSRIIEHIKNNPADIYTYNLIEPVEGSFIRCNCGENVDDFSYSKFIKTEEEIGKQKTQLLMFNIIAKRELFLDYPLDENFNGGSFGDTDWLFRIVTNKNIKLSAIPISLYHFSQVVTKKMKNNNTWLEKREYMEKKHNLTLTQINDTIKTKIENKWI